MSSTLGPGRVPAASITLDLPVEFLSHYEIFESLGKGGMGEVFRARDLDAQRDVAIKFCVAHERPGARELFDQEAALMAKIHHPNVLAVLSSGMVEKVPYLVMPLLKGKTLREILLAKKKLPLAEARAIVDQVLDALDAAHNAGIIHRDLKPENVVVELGGHATVLDLGVAKSWADGSAAKEGAQITGTPAYMPPEQCKGLPTGIAADLYAVGVMLFEMLTGHPPYSAASPRQVMKLHIEASIPRVTEDCPEIDGSWDMLLAKALAKSTSDRFSDARAFRMALTKAAAGHFSGTSLPAARQLERKSLSAFSQSRVATAIGAGVIGVLVVCAWYALLSLEFGLAVAALMPLAALFFHEEPGRFKQLAARADARYAVYAVTTLVVALMAMIQNTMPDLFRLLMYWVIATLQLGWFGGYHDRDPKDRDGVDLHRRANLLVAAITLYMIVDPADHLSVLLCCLTLAFAALGALRRPAKTRHLGIASATTMILMPHLLDEAVAEEKAAAKGKA